MDRQPPAPLFTVLCVTFLGSVGSGTFCAGLYQTATRWSPAVGSSRPNGVVNMLVRLVKHLELEGMEVMLVAPDAVDAP